VTSSRRVVTSLPVSIDGLVCRDRFGAVDVDTFSHRACAQCFRYLFPHAARTVLTAALPDFRYLVRLNASGGVYGDPIMVADPDVDLNTTQEVCSVIGNLKVFIALFGSAVYTYLYIYIYACVCVSFCFLLYRAVGE